MGGPGSGSNNAKAFPPVADWPLTYAEYKADFEPQGQTVADFARAKKLNYSTVHNAFKRLLNKPALVSFHEKNKPLLLKAQSVVREALNKPDVDPGFALRALEKVAEREEPNAGLAQQTNIILPPMFASAKAEAAVRALTEPISLDAPPLESPEERTLKILTQPEE